jgi:hypothetical protein
MKNGVSTGLLKIALLAGGLALVGATNAAAAIDLNECPDLCGSVCYGPSSGMCGQACNYWDEHPSDGYKHCVATTCGNQVPLPCNNSDPDKPGNNGGSGDMGGGGGMSELTWGKPTWQSSTDFGGESVRGVDGNVDGFYWNGSVTHTALQDNPEWGVWIRPGRVVKIVIWNRTDCCGDRISGANVWIRRASNDHTWDRIATLSGNRTRYDINVPNSAGRVSSDAVAIVRDGRARYLSIAEMAVWGWPNSPF